MKIEAVPFSYTNPLDKNVLDQWMRDVSCRDRFKARVLAGELTQLSLDERRVVLSYAMKNDLFEHPHGLTGPDWDQTDEDFVRMAVESGLNTDDFTTDIAFPFSPELFLWLWERGARFEKQNTRSDEGLPKFLIENFNRSTGKEWVNVFITVLPFLKIEEFTSLKRNWQSHLVEILYHKQEAVASSLITYIKRLVEEDPEIVINLCIGLMTGERGFGHSPFNQSSSDNIELHAYIFRQLIKEIVLPHPIIDSIVKHPNVLLYNLSNKKLCTTLEEYYKNRALSYREELKDFRFILFYNALLETTTLNDAALMMHNILYFTQEQFTLSAELKQKCLDHLEKLQKEENEGFWQILTEENNSLGEMRQMKKVLVKLLQFGLNPNWMDRYGNTLLFTDCRGLYDKEQILLFPINIQHLNHEGLNAFEYRLEFPELFLSLGLTLGDKVPYSKECRALISDNDLEHAKMVFCLLDPNGWNVRFFSEKFPHLKEKFIEVLKRRPKLYDQVTCYFEPEKKPDPDARYNVHHAVLKVPTCDQEEALANVLETIKEQETLLLGKIKTPEQLLKTLNSTGIRRFCAALFEQPELMSMVIRQYLRVVSMDIGWECSSTNTHQVFVHELMRRAGPLKHLEKVYAKPIWEDLAKAYHETVVPTPLQKLKVPKDAEAYLAGRSIVIKSADGCHVLKIFLRKKEKFAHFCCESAVTTHYRKLTPEVLQSRFHEPQGVYIVVKLSKRIQKLVETLGEKGAVAVYYYKADEGTLRYFQDLKGEKLESSRQIFLHDVPTMIKEGFQPETIPLYHDEFFQGRSYSIFVDLANYLSNDLDTSYCRGTGRIEHVRAKTKFSNVREDGLTDMGDVQRPFEPKFYRISIGRLNGKYQNPAYQFFYQLDGLGNALLSPMLLLADHYIECGQLDWQNEGFIELFSSQLMDSFAALYSRYAGRSYEEALLFAQKCGIKWKKMATQIAFWIDNGPNGYLQWVLQKKLPPGLYDEETITSVSFVGSPNFDRYKGYRTKGEQDLGSDRGPCGLEEFVKCCYVMSLAVVMADDDGQKERVESVLKF